MIEEWENVFGTQVPLKGTEISDYLSGVWKDVNETEFESR
ncbi:hypothetical protein MTBLM1_20352 [Rhodospirillaceae bacterium LM-1]|nr:hypothetical protein MTBLM1_20352 [Rhodospirillaceae bacterium LM-1]